MADYAMTVCTGRLGFDPELKYTADGTAITTFSLANNTWSKDGEITTWYRCAVFGKRAETLANNVKKGEKLLVQGTPTLRPYTAKDGTEKQSMEIKVTDWSFYGSKTDSAVPPAIQKAAPSQSAPSAWDDSADIPF